MFHVYVLQSERTGEFYRGSTADLSRRMAQHNAGESHSTRHACPWTLVHSEPCNARAEDM